MRKLLLLAAWFLLSCDLRTAAQPETMPQQAAQDRTADGDPLQSVSTDLRNNLFYFWRDRSWCSGVMVRVPETVPAVRAVLTTGSCVSSSPVARSKTVTTPRFLFSLFRSNAHPRIADFLSEYLFEGTAKVGLDNLYSETIGGPGSSGDFDAVFVNGDRSTALYHGALEKDAAFPAEGIVHRDYFSLLKKVTRNKEDAYVVMLRQNDLALMEWNDSEKIPTTTAGGLEIRPKPAPLPGDAYYSAVMLRDNQSRALRLKVTPVEILGFSPRHALIQTCEPVAPPEDYVGDRAAALVIRRKGETILLGLGSFGSPHPQTIEGKTCAITTYAHLGHHKGWMKIALDTLRRFRQEEAGSRK